MLFDNAIVDNIGEKILLFSAILHLVYILFHYRKFKG